MRLSRNSMASDWNCSKTVPICVWVGIQLHLIEMFLRQFRIVLSWNPSASHRTYSMTVSNFVLALIQMHLIGNNLRQYQIVSEPKFNCISSILFYSNSIMRLSRSSMASDWNCSKTIRNCVWAGIQLHLIEILLRQFRIVS